MKAVITGATGLVGANLAALLCERGDDVYCTRRASSRVDHLEGLPIRWVEADVTEADSLARAFRGAEAVFHCAAHVAVRTPATPAMVATNVEGTRRVADAVRRAGVRRLVHCSSVAACAVSTDGSPVTEETPWNFPEHGMGDGYATTKHRAEAVVREAVRAGLDAVIVNPCYMFGPYDARPSSGRLAMEVLKGRVPAYPTGWSNFVDVRDVARGMIAAWERGRPGERYILGGVCLPYRRVMETVAEIGGVRPPRVPLPRWAAMAAGLAGEVAQRFTDRDLALSRSVARHSYKKEYVYAWNKAERELGYRIGPLEDAIADCIGWWRKAGMWG